MEKSEIQQIIQQLNTILETVVETRNVVKQMNINNFDDPLIPNRQLAEILDMRPKQLIQYRKKKLLEAVIIQRRVFYRRSVVRKFLANILTEGINYEREARWRYDSGSTENSY